MKQKIVCCCWFLFRRSRSRGRSRYCGYRLSLFLSLHEFALHIYCVHVNVSVCVRVCVSEHVRIVNANGKLEAKWNNEKEHVEYIGCGEHTGWLRCLQLMCCMWPKRSTISFALWRSCHRLDVTKYWLSQHPVCTSLTNTNTCKIHISVWFLPPQSQFEQRYWGEWRYERTFQYIYSCYIHGHWTWSGLPNAHNMFKFSYMYSL